MKIPHHSAFWEAGVWGRAPLYFYHDQLSAIPPRKCHKTQITNQEAFDNRSYIDFSSLDENVRTPNRCTKGAVRAVLDRLEKKLSNQEFFSLFRTILTDRGGEFGDPECLETLDGKTPYETALADFGEDVMNALQLRPIPPDEVNLTPKLIRQNH